MVGTIWIPGAERITPSIPGGTITSTAPPRVVWHTTEADPGTSTMWLSMIRVLKNKSAEPHVLYDPVTDRLGQFLPLDTSGRALRNDGTYRTNRTGKVCIQVEVIGRAAKPFTGYWKPGPNWRALMAAIRSHGIPDVQPSGAFPKFIADPPHNVPEDERSRTIWLSKAGHYSHSQIPGNDHGDPGGVSFTAMLAAAPKPAPAPTSGDEMTLEELKAYMRLLYGPDGTEGVWNATINAKLDLIVRNQAEMKATLARIEDDTDDGSALHAQVMQELAEIQAVVTPKP